MTVCRYMPTSAHWGRPMSAERAVALLAEGGSALSVRGLQHGRVHLVLPLVPGVAVGHALNGCVLSSASGAPVST